MRSDVDTPQKPLELPVSEDWHRDFSADTPYGVFVTDERGRYLKVNPAACRITGYTEAELLEMHFYDLAPKASRTAAELHLRAVEQAGHSQVELPFRTRDGELRWWSVSAIRLSGARNIGFCKDITDTKRAAEALQKSQAVLEGVLNAIPVRVFWKDRDLNYLGCNRAFAEDAGFTDPDELIGKDDYAMGWREQAELYRGDDRAVIESGVPKPLIEEPQTTSNGGRISLLTSKLPLRDATGAVIGVLGTYYDVTPLRRAEENYRRLFREMQEGLALHELICDEFGKPADYRFLAANPAFEQIMGMPVDRIVGRTVRELLPDVEPIWILTYGRVALTGEPARFEAYSEPLNKHFKVAAFRPEPGQFACIVSDITAQRAAEDERQRLESELRQSTKLQAVGQLAAGIAHEINTPAQFVGDSLMFLQGSCEPIRELLGEYREALAAIAAEGGARERLAEREAAIDLDFLMDNIPAALDDAQDGIARISTIVRAMKEFAHPDQADKAPADLNRALEATLTIARNEYKYVAEVETDFGDLPVVICHAGDLNQVFLNLLVNAAHAIGDVVGNSGDKGTIRVRTWLDGDGACIEIADSGAGIPESIRERIFEPFFTTKPLGKGSGQGLAIAHSIVVGKHGGTLNFDSTPGKGTTFTLRIPVNGGR